MPLRTEHSARMRNPDDFVEDSLRRKKISNGVFILVGKLKSDPEGNTVVQSYRFKTSKFTPQEAKNWMKKEGKKYILFEEAKPEKSTSAVGKIEQVVTALQPTPIEEERENLMGTIFGKNRIIRDPNKKKPDRGRWFERAYNRPEQIQTPTKEK